ncbi:2-oxoacid ferredoxin oxidoreductase [Patescibacteria group bacterium]|nr:2-oxoacid ferredoxin oxidoreductase [Patescibacteria group bacterium]
MTNSDYKKLADRKSDYLAYEGNEIITWCAGCGNYGIQKALERAMVLEGIKPKDALFCYDIGCHGNGSDKIGNKVVYTLHGLHGRVLPVAAGACIANPTIKVIAEGGDGGTMSEGVNHLVHAVRSNYPMVFILHNNENYGLTTGQASACTRKNRPMNGSPDGVISNPMNCCDFVMGLNPTFVARSFSGDVKHMTGILRAALKHNGFAFVEIMQVCPTYNRATPQEWYLERVNYLKTTPKTIDLARKACADLNNKINLGIFYQHKKAPNYMEMLVNRKGVKTTPMEEVERFDIKPLLKQFE